MNPELSRLLDLLSTDIGTTCYISFYSDGSGFVMIEEVPKDRFLLDFDSAGDAVTQIKEYLDMDTSEDD